MADASIPITAGTGTNVDTRTESVNGDHRQVVVLGDPVTGANVAQVSSVGALYIQGFQSTRTAYAVTAAGNSGAISCANYNIATVTVTGTYTGVNLAFEGSDDGGTTWYGVQGVRTDSFVSEATSGVIATTTRAWDIPIGAWTHFRVRASAWATGTASVGISFQSMPYEPSPTVGIGAVGGTAVTTANLPANVAQINGVTPLMGSGVNGTGAQRITIATDQAALSVAGVLSAKVDQTTIGVTNGVALVAASGNAVNCLTSATGALTTAVVKASTGNVFGMSIANLTASTIYIQFYNQTTAPTLGTGVVWFIAVPASSTVTMAPGGLAMANFSTGIGIGASTTATGAGTPATAPAVTIFYK